MLFLLRRTISKKGVAMIKIHNVHERVLGVPARQVGALLDTLTSGNDQMWPSERWPALRIDGRKRRPSQGET